MGERKIKEERQQLTTTEARKILSCSSRWSSLSISSVFTEQWQKRLQNCQLVRELLGNPLHQVSWINTKFLDNLLSQNCKPMKSDWETCCKNLRNDLRNCQKTRSYPELCSEAGLSLVELDNSSVHSGHQEEKETNLYAENIRCLENQKELKWKDGPKSMYDLAQSRT